MREFCKYRVITGMQQGYCFFIVIISACTCFEKFGELGIQMAGAYATHQIKIRCLKICFKTNESALYPRPPSA